MQNLVQRINVGDSLTRTAALRPTLVDGERRWCYAELNGWVNRLAHGLAARGYSRGDGLGLASANSAEFLAVYCPCAKLGVVYAADPHVAEVVVDELPGPSTGKIQRNKVREAHNGGTT